LRSALANPTIGVMRPALLLTLLLAGPAFADDPKPEGEYSGVQPGQPKKAEATKKPKKPPPKGTLSWIGFEVKDGGSDVFLQSIAPFEVNQRVDGGVVVVSLSGLTRLGHNIWRPIDTRFFETPLSRIVARKKGKGVEVRIAFKSAKRAAPASVHTGSEADGMYYAHLTFAGGGGGAAKEAEPEKK
jgi:hypothetical protein